MKTVFVLITGLLVGSAWAAEHAYIGAAKCAKMCHKSSKQGEQYPIWQKSAHANAYQTLATPEALEVGRKVGVAEPQKSEKCLKCHVTGFAAPANLKEPTYAIEEGVTCEACHGAGKDYSKLSVMKDTKLSMAAGLIHPDEKVCVKCHNAESPNYKPFNFKEMLKKIAHPTPPKASAQ